MDALDQLAAPAAGLLDRVDAVLAAAGAPADHPVWPLLRRLGVLPSDALGTIMSLRPAPPAAVGPVRELIGAYEAARAAVSEGGSWEGAAAQVFAAHRGALSDHLVGLTGRTATLEAYGEAVADWVRQTRVELAGELATILRSAEAVTVVTEPGGPAAPAAAAGIAARVLDVVDEAYDRAESLMNQWAGELHELPYRPPDPGAPALDLTTRLA
ncbi:hypothetical protein WEI85_41590 [Actinomycetes bacterium KLBMP 9797]